MLVSHALQLLWLSSVGAHAAVTVTGTKDTTSTDTATSSTSAEAADQIPSGATYESYTTTITMPSTTAVDVVNGTVTMAASTMAASNTTDATASTTSSVSLTVLSGGGASSSSNATTSGNATATSTSTSAIATNTQPCNGYASFCERKWGNITWVAAHNSPFVRAGNAASNQALDVTTQLNDGIRMLQMQSHYVNGTIYLCHTSCDLLNVGTLESYLVKVTQWLSTHPYDVVSILIGNGDLIAPANYTAPITDSGLINYVYTPPQIPMGKDDWPTLASFILSGKRAMVFLDYQANQTAIPWLMDEFSQIWETPFSPTNDSFPCTEQRPPNLAVEKAKSILYMANHNLNTEISIAGSSLLLPNTIAIDQTNAVSGASSLGEMATTCNDTWGSPPNFLLVDYYNYGNFNGSVFQVAADWNNVTYDRNSCCGTVSTSGASASNTNNSWILHMALMSVLLLFFC